jgi:hypothetical protein
VTIHSALDWFFSILSILGTLAALAGYWDFATPYGRAMGVVEALIFAPSIPAFWFHPSVPAGLMSVADSIWWYLIWKNRPPRKRKPSKVLAKIKDLGHKLVTVPT